MKFQLVFCFMLLSGIIVAREDRESIAKENTRDTSVIQRRGKTKLDSLQKQFEIELLSGVAEMDRKAYKKAIVHFTVAIQTKPHIASGYFNRGKCFLKLKDKKAAFIDFQKAKELGIKDPELENYLNKCNDKE